MRACLSSRRRRGSSPKDAQPIAGVFNRLRVVLPEIFPVFASTAQTTLKVPVKYRTPSTASGVKSGASDR